MKKWLKQLFCFHKWEQTECQSDYAINQSLSFVVTYRCKKCGKVKCERVFP